MTSRLLPTPNVVDSTGRQYQYSQGNHSKKVLCLPGAINDPSFSQAVSPASLSHAPESAEARKMTVISGKKCCELLKSSSPLGLSVRMLMESDLWSSKTVFLNWREIPLFKRTETAITQTSWTESATVLKLSATKFSRLLFQLAPSTPRTEGIGSGLLRTPQQQEPGSRPEQLVTKDGKPMKIGERAYDKDTGRLAQVGLHQQIAMLPTPATRDYKGARKPETLALTGRNPETNSLEDSLLHSGNKTGTPLRLEPAFVEWMQGYPEGYTELTD